MLNFSTFSVIFFIRKNKSFSEQQPIYARITVNGKRSEISLKRSVLVSQWDSSKGRARGTSQNIRALNNYLDTVYSRLMDCHSKLIEKDKLITSQAIKSSFLGLDQDHKTLKDIIDYHNNHLMSVLQPGTLKNYYTTEKYLYKFLDKCMKTDDIYLKGLSYRFITDFEHFLRTYKPEKERRTCNNNGTMKHLERLKKMINLAVKLEWIPKNPFINYQLKFQKNERHYLNHHELGVLENTIFTSKTLERVKDIFIFSCYTGLSYIDLKELTEDQVVKNNGSNWIYAKRIKTNETVKIPLLKQAQEILDKYHDKNGAGNNPIFPAVSNQKMNVYLKEIASSIGIRKNISFHSARHTFATTVTLANGVPIETVSKLLGHTKLSTTQIYARVLEQKLSTDMQNLADAFKRKQQSESGFPKRVI